MTNKEILQDALNILELIPQDKWITDVYTNYSGKCCALGHYGTHYDSYYRAELLRSASKIALRILHPDIPSQNRISIATINNFSNVNGYTESEIKDRVIHFLKDAVAIEEDF